MQSQSRQSIYDNISPYFQRLYIYDIQNEPFELLQELIRRLKGGQQLSADLRVLYNKLENASKRNIQTKLRKKKQHGLASAIPSNASNIEDSLAFPEESSLYIEPIKKSKVNLLDEFSYSVDESMVFDPLPTNYKQLESKSGKILGGEYLASFTLSDLTKSKTIETLFKVDPRKQQSTISREAQRDLNLKSLQPMLLVDGHRERFRLSDQNVLGLRYLQQNKIIMEFNFRPEISSFELSYTE